jgi:alginate O-acetyltransferase complex protein AlgI
MFVPTMVAGPIKRFQGFSEQLPDAETSAGDVDAGIRRILIGLLKKIVFADTINLWTAPLASGAALGGATRADIAVALLAYSLRIYLDFSAYSDIAIGSARLFGLRVPENFSWPYLKRNISEFWRSWHMSLTSWIRDYVYIPLGGNRKGDARRYVNLVTAMAVSGIWHGAGWNFLGWGVYHGVLMALHRFWTSAKLFAPIRSRLAPEVATGPAAKALKSTGAVLSVALTFSLVTFGWGLFAMPFSRFVQMLQILFGGAR